LSDVDVIPEARLAAMFTVNRNGRLKLKKPARSQGQDALDRRLPGSFESSG